MTPSSIIVKVAGFVTFSLTCSLGDRIRFYPTPSVVSAFHCVSFMWLRRALTWGATNDCKRVSLKIHGVDSPESDHRCPQPRGSSTSGGHSRRGAGAPPTTTRPSPRVTLRRYPSGGWGRPRREPLTRLPHSGGGGGGRWLCGGARWALPRRAPASHSAGRRARAGATRLFALEPVPTVWRGGARRCHPRGRRGVPRTPCGIPPALAARQGGSASQRGVGGGGNGRRSDGRP